MKALRFLHIPKTAGSTLESILKCEYFGKSFSFDGNIPLDLKKFETLPQNHREKVVLFIGHSPIATGIQRADTATIITLLRDPISRVKSFCQHVSEGKSPYLIDKFPPETFNLDNFLESGHGELSNLQTKMLINHGSTSSSSLLEIMSFIEAKDTALDNLFNKISYFGLQEYFDESLMIFSSALNWKIPLYTSKNKKNTHKLIRFEKRHLEHIKEFNSIDIEVYKVAKEQFIQVLNKEEFDKENLHKFQSFNSSRSFIPSIVKNRKRIVCLTKRCISQPSSCAKKVAKNLSKVFKI